MDKIGMMALAKIRKNKGQAASLLVLVAIATLLFYLGLVLYIGFGTAFDERAEELNMPHFAIVQDSTLTTDAQLSYLREYPEVREVEKQSVIAGFGDYFLDGAKVFGGIIIARSQDNQNMNPPLLIGESAPLTNGSIYAPNLIRSSGGYELGDDYPFNLAGSELHFTIAGFTEELVFGSQNMLALRFYVSDESYAQIAREFPEQQCSLLSARLADSALGSELYLDYTREFFHTEGNGESSGLFVSSIYYQELKDVLVLMPTILAMMMVAFAVILLAISLIVIRFRIVNSIEEEMANTGVLKAMGYRSWQIIAAFVLQFAGIALIGALVGIALSALALPFVAGILEALSAMVWEPGFDSGFAAFALVFMVLAVVLVACVVSFRIRRLHPLAALRSGFAARNFKKDSVSLAATPGPLPLLLAIKQLMQGKRQALAIAFIIATLSFASVAGVSLYYNVGVNNEAFIALLLGDNPDVGLIVQNSGETEGVLARISERPEVRKAFCYQSYGLTLLVEGDNINVFVARDFSLLEGPMLVEGDYPTGNNEVAIGGLLSEDIGRGIGDTIIVEQGGRKREFKITGTIQSMENFGINLAMTYDGVITVKDDFEFSNIYIYLTEGADADAFIKSIKAQEGDIFSNTVNIQELADAFIGPYSTIFAAVASVILAITAVVIVLVLSMVIKTMILRCRRELGIQKALGFTTLQLMTQIALNFTPAVFVGVIVGGIAGYLGFNPLFVTLLHSAGIMKTELPSPLVWTIVACLALVALSYLTSMLIAWRIRKISPAVLVGE